MQSYYGNYRTRIFSQIWDTSTKFINDVKNCGLSINLSDDDLTDLFYLLYARFGNSNIASSDENRFKYNVYSIIYSKGSKWAKQKEIQKKLMELTDDQIRQSQRFINNHAYNPSEIDNPSAGQDVELKYINEQNQSYQKSGYLTAYQNYMDSLVDVTTWFIETFSKLFIKICVPTGPLWYITEGEDNEDE